MDKPEENPALIEKNRSERDEAFRRRCDQQFHPSKQDIYKYTMRSTKKPPPERYDAESFGIHHYAALVTYNVKSWWDLNKSTLPRLVRHV